MAKEQVYGETKSEVVHRSRRPAACQPANGSAAPFSTLVDSQVRLHWPIYGPCPVVWVLPSHHL